MNEEKYREAVVWAVDFLPEKMTNYSDLEHEVRTNENWWTPIHMGWGMWFRNQMRTNGFTDQVMGCNLDDCYIEIVNEAVLGEPRPLNLPDIQIIRQDEKQTVMEISWDKEGF